MKVLVVILILVIVTLGIANYKLECRNRRLVLAVREVVFNREAHCIGYIEPGEAVKEIYIRRLIKWGQKN